MWALAGRTTAKEDDSMLKDAAHKGWKSPHLKVEA